MRSGTFRRSAGGRERGGGRARWTVAVVALLLASGAVTELRAQQSPPVDSTQLRVQERLRRLARPPGADSALYLQDSVARAEAQQRSGVSAGQDSTLQALLEIDGYSVTEYEGGQAAFGTVRRSLVLQAPESGRARVNRDGLEVQADTSITYDEASGRVRTVGASTFTPTTGDPVESGNLVYDLQSSRGSARDAETSYAQGTGDWLVRGDMPYATQDSTFMSHARFTSCDLEVPHYHFQTDEIKIVGDNVLVARPVRLYFADVPVMWLPFIAQSLSSGRSSGLLTPRFSVNDIVRTSGGYNRRVSNLGFYWAMSQYTDALFAVDWFSDNFTAVTGSFRYNWARQFLNGNLDYRQYWRADGSAEQSLNTSHSWEINERTRLSLSGRWTSDSDFVRDNSFNPREVTQSIDSEGGINRRFDWGSVNVGANRRQYLSDDRVEWTLPSASVSLSTITLFPASSGDASLFNNMTWSGSSNFSRQTVDRATEVGDTFAIGQANTTATRARFSSNLSLGNLTFTQGVQYQENAKRDIPAAFFVNQDDETGPLLVTDGAAEQFAETDLNWSLGLDYQQQLIGSTTLTPNLNLQGRQFKSDTSNIAGSFVSAPTRTSFGATLKTDIYGFFPGAGGFETIRHKFSPSFNYEWSPESAPNELQSQVFGSRVLQPRNVVSVTLNQTFEAKRPAPEETDTAGAAPVADSLPADSAAAGPPAAAAPPGVGAVGGTGGLGGEEFERVERAEIVQLLALRTSVVRYDFVEADSAGDFLAGFQTTRLSNQISSDFLRGLSLSVDHDLFEEPEGQDGGGVEGSTGRRFAPHLAQLNLSFALSNRTGLFRWIGGLLGSEGGDGTEEPEPEEEYDPELDAALDPFADGPTNESSIVPDRARATQPQRQRQAQGGWNANLSYSLQRPRSDDAQVSQMLNGTLSLRPTDQWDLSWRTSFDLEEGAFNDHTIRLSRDLHRWRANFDFLQTATGNWTFRFEVSLLDNQDLKFDYEQRNLDAGLRSQQR